MFTRGASRRLHEVRRREGYVTIKRQATRLVTGAFDGSQVVRAQNLTYVEPAAATRALTPVGISSPHTRTNVKLFGGVQLG